MSNPTDGPPPSAPDNGAADKLKQTNKKLADISAEARTHRNYAELSAIYSNGAGLEAQEKAAITHSDVHRHSAGANAVRPSDSADNHGANMREMTDAAQQRQPHQRNYRQLAVEMSQQNAQSQSQGRGGQSAS